MTKLNDDKRLIQKLRYEIRKRDVVIRNLRESGDQLRRSLIKVVNLMASPPQENLDYGEEITGETRI